MATTTPSSNMSQQTEGQKQHNAYVPGHKAAHISHHAWRTAENSCGYLLPTLKSMVQEKPKLRLLDAGCGPGSISVSLASYIPQGEVLATDFVEDIVSRAASYAESQGAANVKCEVASIYELPYPDASFDVVHTSQVLVHLDDPLSAMKELLRVCKPGGVVAAREAEMRMFSYYPATPMLLAAHELATKCHAAGGGSVDMGVKLVSTAMKAGVKREKITATMSTWCYSTPEEREMFGGVTITRLVEGGMRKKALELGLTTEEELGRMVEAWKQWIEAEDGCMGITSGEVVIRK